MVIINIINYGVSKKAYVGFCFPIVSLQNKLHLSILHYTRYDKLSNVNIDFTI